MLFNALKIACDNKSEYIRSIWKRKA